MSAGRVFHLDQPFRDDSRATWFARCLGRAALLGLPLLALWLAPLSPREADDLLPPAWFKAFAALAIFLLWCVIELAMWHALYFELRLLPDGIQLSSWGRTRTIIEPRIVAAYGLHPRGFIFLDDAGASASWSSLFLRTTICLSHFSRRQDKAAIVAHCSQFLTPEQQSRHGKHWANVYYSLIAPPKPQPHGIKRLMIAITATAALGELILIGVVETLICQFSGEFMLNNGLPTRRLYGMWLIGNAVFAAVVGVATWLGNRTLGQAVA